MAEEKKTTGTKKTTRFDQTTEQQVPTHQGEKR